MKTRKALQCLAFLLCLLLAIPFAAFAEGEAEGTPKQEPSTYSGTPDTSWFTESNPQYDAETKTYTLTSADQFAGLAKVVSEENSWLAGYTIRLGVDVVFNAGSVEDWASGEAPANAYTPIQEFSGTFDGDGHIISGVYFYEGATGNVGLFSTLNGATVKNLAIVNSMFVGSTQIGALVGRIRGNAATISDIYVDAMIFATKHHAGGIVGALETSTDKPMNGQTSIERCAFAGSVSAFTGQYSGGIMSNSNGVEFVLRNCINMGEIGANTKRAGGIIGTSWILNNTKTTVIEYCINAGAVNTPESAGTIIGYHKVNALNLSHYISLSGSVKNNTVIGEIPDVEPVLTDGQVMTEAEIKAFTGWEGWVSVADSYPMPSRTVADMLTRAKNADTPEPTPNPGPNPGSDEKPSDSTPTGTATGKPEQSTEKPSDTTPSTSGSTASTEPAENKAGCKSSVGAGLPLAVLLLCGAWLGRKERKNR